MKMAELTERLEHYANQDHQIKVGLETRHDNKGNWHCVVVSIRRFVAPSWRPSATAKMVYAPYSELAMLKRYDFHPIETVVVARYRSRKQAVIRFTNLRNTIYRDWDGKFYIAPF